MLEPQFKKDWLPGNAIEQFIGGTKNFDLWKTGEASAFPLRVVQSSKHRGIIWDDFKLPLSNNKFTSADWIHGRWAIVYLDHYNAYDIETYLRCFAPWMLGKGLTDG